MSHFKVTMGKGVNIQFDNGWAISIQWGPGNYCSNEDLSTLPGDEGITDWFSQYGKKGSSDAEIAVFNPSKGMIALNGVPHCFDDDGYADTVKGRLTPNQVLDVMNWVANQ